MTSYKILTQPAGSPELPEARYAGFAPGTRVLRAGYRHTKRARPLACDIVHDRDVALVMRDGTTIYADVFRPVTDDQVPAIVNWAPYGKGGAGIQNLDNPKLAPRRMGIPKSAVSGLQSWEGNDPAYWCAHGYAVVQVDARGAFDSEGDIRYQSSAEGEDGHDAIEGVAALPWCSGAVGMAGNSWLALAQWHIAAQQPPHLAAIAPWEGLSDLYRDLICRGGVPDTGFASGIASWLYGRGQVEDPVAMLDEHPLFDDYWADKVADFTRIQVPAYVVSSYSNQLHANGTMRAWAGLGGPSWLRIHNSMEWVDFYRPERVDDLRRFFDRFLKGLENGWEATPRVRMSVLDPGHVDVIDRPERDFPPARVADRVLHLDSRARHLVDEPVETPDSVGYELAAKESWVDFVHTFDDDVEVIGHPLVTLWVTAEGHEDMDIYVQLGKLDARGRRQRHQPLDLGLRLGRRWMPVLAEAGVHQLDALFYSGPSGVLRASRRGLRGTASGGLELALDSEQPLPGSGAVEVTIPLWPVAMRWHAGEQLRLRISARSQVPPPPLPGLQQLPLQPGRRHVIHTGGERDSRLILPMTSATFGDNDGETS